MTGHQPLIDMRRAGFKPAYVWLTTENRSTTDHGVRIDDTDIPEALDLRFLVGVTVIADSQDRDRLQRVLKACMASKAARVVASLFQRFEHGSVEILEITDTEGVMTWRK